MTEFAVVSAIVICIFAWAHIAGERKLRQQKASLLVRRPNLTLDEFIDFLRDDCEPDIARLLWTELLVFYQPDMTPHPDDDVIQDMPIDHDEPNDWLAQFCKINAMRVKDVLPWPQDRPATVRNLARWFSQSRQHLIAQR